jgi:hypothetical protein
MPMEPWRPVRVLSVQSVSSLSDGEARLLDGLIADTGPDSVAPEELAVYVVQTLMTPEEVLNLGLTPEEQEHLERPSKIVAPQNAKIAACSYAYNASVVTASASARGTELTLAEALIVTDERGEFLEPPPAAWLASHADP